MKLSSFQDKLHKAQTLRATNQALLMLPRLTKMPLPMQHYDDPFLPFGKAIIAATKDLVCAYVFDLAAYLALGAAGAVALERTIASVDDQTVTILHGPFVGSDFIEMAQAFNVDALTLIHASDALAYDAAGIGTLLVNEGSLALASIAVVTPQMSLNLKMLDENVLYAGRGDDFAAQVRAALQ